MNTPSRVAEPLYEARLRILATTDFGYPLQALASGSAQPPPWGARFDFAFEGSVEGARLTGTVVGVDYLNIRADGRIELHIHGRLNTADGASLSYSGNGVALPQPGTGLLHFSENVLLHCSDPRYTWVNRLPVWARGTIELARGEIRATGFASPESTGTGPLAP